MESGPAAAHEYALTRWWQGRLDWVSGADPLGGRFTPVGVGKPASASIELSLGAAVAEFNAWIAEVDKAWRRVRVKAHVKSRRSRCV